MESVYSAEGDTAPLVLIAELTAKYDAALIVDEAHATGIFGDKGGGLGTAAGCSSRLLPGYILLGKARVAMGPRCWAAIS